MNKRVIVFIIIFSSVSLVVAIITQLFWAKDAIALKEDQFTGKVDIAMKSVVNHLMTSESFSPANPMGFDTAFYQTHVGILNAVDPKALDSLLHAEMETMNIMREYVYGVYGQLDSVFVMGEYGTYKDNLYHSEHQISLSCLCDNDQYILSVYYPHQQSIIISDMIILPVMSGLFLLVLVFSFFFTIFTLFKQKKLSEMKTDFVNNMTHEFKTPIATISASSEMLGREPVYTSPDKVQRYAHIIFDENERLKNQVERILQIATVEKGEVRLKMKELDVHELLHESIKHFNVQVADRMGMLKAQLQAKNPVVRADRGHLVNIFANLLDNANKYSHEKPEITISTENSNQSLIVRFKDNGIGIRKEDRQHIFKKFHRLQTGDIHDVKGFGIGLFYVKTVIEEMGGKISVSSEVGKGSEFTIELPLNN